MLKLTAFLKMKLKMVTEIKQGKHGGYNSEWEIIKLKLKFK